MRGFLERPATGKVVDALLIINAILLAALTFSQLSDDARSMMECLDRGIFAIFIIELLVRIAVYRREFFQKGWNIFDFVIINLFVAVVYDAYYLMKAGDEPKPPAAEPSAAE